MARLVPEGEYMAEEFPAKTQRPQRRERESVYFAFIQELAAT
jgi:hypothetical protein